MWKFSKNVFNMFSDVMKWFKAKYLILVTVDGLESYIGVVSNIVSRFFLELYFHVLQALKSCVNVGQLLNI